MTALKEFSRSQPRPLPVLLLADVSGSMAADGKIQALNQAVREMVSSFAQADDLRATIHVAVISFGGEAQLHTPLQPAAAVRWQEMQADGGTPMGQAMELAADLIEDQSVIPGRAYRPAVILVSDGQPTDAWQQGLDRLTRQGRAPKADRLALAIGADADEKMLAAFLADPRKKVFRAADAAAIRKFFNFVTMSVTSRSRSADPNDVPHLADPFTLDNF